MIEQPPETARVSMKFTYDGLEVEIRARVSPAGSLPPFSNASVFDAAHESEGLSRSLLEALPETMRTAHSRLHAALEIARSSLLMEQCPEIVPAPARPGRKEVPYDEGNREHRAIVRRFLDGEKLPVAWLNTILTSETFRSRVKSGGLKTVDLTNGPDRFLKVTFYVPFPEAGQ